MASIKSFGKLSGSYGPGSFSTYKGKNIYKTKPLSIKNPKSPSQRINRGKFKKMTALAHFLNPFIKRTFAGYTTKTNAFNIFSSINYYANVIAGKFPDFEYDFPKMIVALGDLKIAEGGKIMVSTDKKIIVEWKNNSGRGGKYSSDVAIVLLISETKNEFDSFDKVATRRDKKMEITPLSGWADDKIHVYLLFKDREFEEFSDSVYLGNVILSKEYSDMSEAGIFSASYVKKIHKDNELILKGIGNGLVKIENGEEINYKLDFNSDLKKTRPADREIAELINQTKNVVKSYFGPAAESNAILKIKLPPDWAKDKIQVNLTINIQVTK
jgi:hypothetical protein